MFSNSLTLEQSRQLVDVRQVFESFEAAGAEAGDRFRGSMAWKQVAGREYLYLYRRRGKSDNSLGPRSHETETAMEAFTAGKV